MILSSFASSTIEEVAQSSPEGLKWSHVFITSSEDTISWIRRAENEGYKALVVTIDNPYLGRGHETRNPLHMPPHISVPRFQNLLKDTESSKATRESLLANRAKFTWDKVSWLR